MPYPNEHACRLRDPKDFEDGSFRRTTRKHNGKDYSVIMGRIKGEDTMTEQAYRYAKDSWEPEDARAHCKEHKGMMFEPAKEEKKSREAYETRSFQAVELRAKMEAGKAPVIEGYAAVFDSLSEDLGGFREKIRPGAFKGAIADGCDVRALWNHDNNFVLGRTTARTLSLSEDDRGLLATIHPPDTQWARDLMVSIGRGDVSQMSFGFQVEKDEWDDKDKNSVVRTIHSFRRLFDVSPVTSPAYPDTTVALRSLEEHRNTNMNPPEADAPTEQVPEWKPTHQPGYLRKRLELKEKETNNL